MKPCFIDLHIHTSEDSNNANELYNVDILLEKFAAYIDEIIKLRNRILIDT